MSRLALARAVNQVGKVMPASGKGIGVGVVVAPGTGVLVGPSAGGVEVGSGVPVGVGVLVGPPPTLKLKVQANDGLSRETSKLSTSWVAHVGVAVGAIAGAG